MPVNVALLWHMHQPVYIDPDTGQFVMPWVRLHGVKAYNDMAGILKDAPEYAKATINLVPSLLWQIGLYKERQDTFFQLSQRHPDTLDAQERSFIVRYFFSCHWPTMIEPYERYRQLLSKRGRSVEEVDAQGLFKEFSDQDILDLQVWFNLTWMGFEARRDPFIQGLFGKGRLFTQEEKEGLLKRHLEILEGLVDSYKALWEKGTIDITTTPFYHPILPLILDSNIARRAMPESTLPPRFSYPDDAREQLIRARDYIEELFQKSPQGLWPSEGSVCPELISLVRDAGFAWIATDDGILQQTLGEDPGLRRFEPFYVEHDGVELPIVFRHHELSDLIGFSYHKTDPQIATNDLAGRLREIARATSGMDRPPLCAIILDGENPWEYYADGGKTLLQGIYNEVSKDPEINLVTVTEYLSQYPPTRHLNGIHSGSWINADYGIWIGGKEENAAWEELGNARAAVENARMVRGDKDEGVKAAMENLYVAEGSDWFWWYGDKFQTDFGHLFDRLFRSYLKAAYTSLGEAWPETLERPIKEQAAPPVVEEPMGFINPEIDGRLSFYWEWSGAGVIKQESLTSMYRVSQCLSKVLYGFNLQWFYLMLVPATPLEELSRHRTEFKVLVHGQRHLKLVLPLHDEGQWAASFSRVWVDGTEKTLEDTGIRVAMEEVCEMGFPFALTGCGVGEEMGFAVEVMQDKILVERWPQSGTLEIVVPDQDFERRIWLI